MSRPRVPVIVMMVVVLCSGCAGAADVDPGSDDPGPSATTTALIAPLDSVRTCSPAGTPVGPEPPPYPPPLIPPGFPPPPLPPEAQAELDRLASVVDRVPAAEKAPEDATGVIYIGDKGLETIDSYMGRVLDNAEWFWERLLGRGALACAYESVERRWVKGGRIDGGPCGRPVHPGSTAYYCGTAGESGTQGAIVVGTRWMFESVYERFDDDAEFAVASVLAHEMGHHVQDVLGLLLDRAPFRCCGLRNINIELHADCLGGVWASSLYGRGEIDLATMADAVRAAQASSDLPQVDRAGGEAHGTAAERREWYMRGFETGEVDECAPSLLLVP